MTKEFNYARAARLVKAAVEAVELDLSGMTVYTESATGGFASTAALAVCAGADTVYAIGKDSQYGSAADARSHTTRLARRVGDENNLVFTKRKQKDNFADADLVTNTGFVRRIDETVANWLGPDSAVPLMYEPWEFRDDDVDIDALWANGIPVLGTNERDERVATQRYLRSLAVKLALQCDLEVCRGSFAVIGGGRMARHAATGLRSLGGMVTRIDPESVDQPNDALSGELLGDLDALFVVDHQTDDLLIGDCGLFDPGRIAGLTCGTTVVHVCGPVSARDMEEAGLRYIPERPAAAGRMSYTTGHLGPRPIVELHAAGLRVGADLVDEQRAGANFRTATERVAETPLAADFDEEFKCIHGFYD